MWRDNLDRFFSKLEWRWSLANMVWGASAIASATFPAWAVRATDVFAEYAPISWVSAGFIGFLLFCIGFLIYSYARDRVVRARYNARALQKGGTADPFERVFERKRIFLNEFALPSNPYIHNKVFVDCEIVGPANIYLAFGNRIDEYTVPKCDAVVLTPEAQFANGFTFYNCTFKRCSLQRITIFLSDKEYRATPNIKGLDWLNWITYLPDSEFPLYDEDRDVTEAIPPRIADGAESERQQ